MCVLALPWDRFCQVLAQHARPSPRHASPVHVELRIPCSRSFAHKLTTASSALPSDTHERPTHGIEWIAKIQQTLQAHHVTVQNRRLLAVVRVTRVQLAQSLEASTQCMSQTVLHLRNTGSAHTPRWIQSEFVVRTHMRDVRRRRVSCIVSDARFTWVIDHIHR